jgi:5-methylcytosine-specific restriction enzyme subunit McrC
MNIPIQNIYYLLCYSWNKLEESRIVNVAGEDSTKILDLFTKVLIGGTNYVLKKGLDRNYREIEEESNRISGRILMDEVIKRNLFKSGVIRRRFDELSYNILHNKIIKGTFLKIIRLREIDAALREEAIRIFKRFPYVGSLDIKKKDFSELRLNRNNYFYDFLIKICEIINDSLLISEKTGEYKFRDFLRDDKRMAQLFEQFVRNFYKKEQAFYDVSREKIHWYMDKVGKDDDFLPAMETDICLTAKDYSRKLIIETKYYSGGFKAQTWPGSREKLISENLYQLYAYLKNLESRKGINEKCEGLLLYAAVDEEADLCFNLSGHLVRVKTLNLNQDWRKIHSSMLGII